MPWSSDELPKTSNSVIFLAQSEFLRDFPRRAKNIFAVNTSSVVGMLDYARESGAKTFVFASSGGIYGPEQDERIEKIPVAARGDLGFYLSTKLCSEILVEAYSSIFNIVILRIFFAYGKGQHPNMLIPRLVGRIKRREPVYLDGEDGITLNPVHVSDVVRSIEASLSLAGVNKVNVAGSEIFNIRDLCMLIGARLGTEPVFEVRDVVGSTSLVGDVSVMSRLLGAPERSFAVGLEDVL
jgi:nucleoside-diphosphate-sugar epimerase